MGSSWAVRSTAIVETAEDVEALAVDIEVEDHHDEEVHQAEQQHSLADPLQGPAQHQPAHGQSHTAHSTTRIWSTSPLRTAEPPGLQFTNITYKTKTRGVILHSCAFVTSLLGWDQTSSGLKTKHNSKGRKSFKLKHCVLLVLNALYCSRQLLFSQTLIMLIRYQRSFPVTVLILQ